MLAMLALCKESLPVIFTANTIDPPVTRLATGAAHGHC